MNYLLIFLGWILHLCIKIGNAKAKYKCEFRLGKWIIDNYIYTISSLLCCLVIILSANLSDDLDKKIEVIGIEFYYMRITSLMIGLCSTSVIYEFILMFKFLKIK